MYALRVSSEADKVFSKLVQKNKKQLEILHKKLLEVRENPHHEYKHLRSPLQNYSRIHIDKHFVVIFRINHADQSIDVFFYGHHDEAYQWRPSGKSEMV